jgi:hypothetical protein
LKRQIWHRIVTGALLLRLVLSFCLDNTALATPPRVKLVPTAAERKVINAAGGGPNADFGSYDDPANGGEWGPERTIRAEIIYALAAEINPEWPVDSNGLAISGAKVVGYLNLTGAKIQRPLQLVNCYFQDPIYLVDADTSAISFNGSHVSTIVAERLKSRGSVWLGNGFTATDQVDLNDANITGQLGLAGGRFLGSKPISLNLSGVRVSSALRMEGLLEKPKGIVDLRWAHVAQLTDDAASWPIQNSLLLDGFTYDGFVESPIKGRLAWLRLQPNVPFRPQPYEQLTNTLRRMGYQAEAQQISIAEQRAWRDSGELSTLSLTWDCVLDYALRYGYEPWRILIPIGLILGCARKSKVIMPSQNWIYESPTYKASGGNARPQEYPPFNAILYSLDSFLPFVDLNQKSQWWLNPRRPFDYGYWAYEAYFFAHTLLGWALIAIVVAAIGGLIRNG